MDAAGIYAAYLVKVAELKKHQDYARLVERATYGGGQTPVEPLATMGTGGGPLLCDHCNKPMLLEGGQYNKVYADKAWASNPKRDSKWKSWISGGMVVDIVENGTVRIYHGYIGHPTHCCELNKKITEEQEAAFKSLKTPDIMKGLRAIVSEVHKDKDEKEQNSILSDIVSLMLRFDVGVGVNKPE